MKPLSLSLMSRSKQAQGPSGTMRGRLDIVWRNQADTRYNRAVFSERELKFMFAICHRRSVCLSSVVCNVRAPYSDD